MEATPGERISFRNAYEQINFYDSQHRSKKPIITRSNGPTEFVGLFRKDVHQVEVQDEGQVMMCAQPFYVGEVDHNIEQIGLMAIRQVRYVDEDQWIEIMKENQKYEEIVKQERAKQAKEARKKYALSRTRNEKGQFISKEKQKSKKDDKKNKKIGKRTRGKKINGKDKRKITEKQYKQGAYCLQDE